MSDRSNWFSTRATLVLGVVLTSSTGALFSLPAFADSNDAWDGNWHGSITPYGWLPGVSGETRYQLPNGPEVEVKNKSDPLSSLSGALLLEGDIRKGNWGLFGDIDWIKFSDEKGRFRSIGGERIEGSGDLDTRWGMKGGLITLAGLYTMAHGTLGYADLMFGARYVWLKGNISWNLNVTGGNALILQGSGHLHNQTHAGNGIIGVRGRWTPFAGTGWYFPYYADVGTGDSDNTYQLNIGVGYSFHWGDIALSYRDIKYEQGGDDKFLKRAELSGPSFNYTWQF
ncbi:hypothetical protein [Dyella japonica]|uniref:Outer membrane protein beta-barrel domain-containing protein n=1 Tax=Dyella japonica TaxID=231455 RepID=A0ABV2JXD4_9GAMM